MVPIFFSALAVGFSGAVMPGPLLTYTIRQTLARGPRAGFIVTAGHAALELVLIALIFLGFDAILQSQAAQTGISIAGGALLLWMGIDMLLRAAKGRVAAPSADAGEKKGSLFLAGVVISTGNPYFLVWWAVIGLAQIMQAHNALGWPGVPVYYVGHIAADFIWYGVVSGVVGATRRFIKEKPYRVLIAALGLILMFFGGQFVYSGISMLVS
jgi:threonine/homoserine/homoserine lactone efflux protein